MGVKHAREYKEILEELKEAIGSIDDGYRFFDMETDEWEALAEPERMDVMEALADDVFYGLGVEPVIKVGGGMVAYRQKHHCIEVSVDGRESRIIRLI